MDELADNNIINAVTSLESPLKIANYFVSKSINTGKELSPIKVLKLVYLSHGWYLGLTDKALIGEAVQAWKYGPVVEGVYHAFKSYGSEQITSYAIDYNSNKIKIPIPTLENDKVLIEFLDRIWEVYGDLSGLILSTITHETGSPWDIIYNKQGGKDKHGTIIPNDLIRDYYKRKAQE